MIYIESRCCNCGFAAPTIKTSNTKRTGGAVLSRNIDITVSVNNYLILLTDSIITTT